VVLGVIEIAVFLALAITLIIKAGGHNTLAVFSATEHNKNGFWVARAGCPVRRLRDHRVRGGRAAWGGST
jgi:hypothetical protein